ncbi:calcium-translocating P-type ATPase, SERCA-type [Candidatus Woesearchaeota archaeon]|nr:calcium-translocating P-type ATPase, SERCA-type [Candidatus Woesearchaeota archaeon]
MELYHVSQEEALKQFQSSQQGLSSAEARKRLEVYGANVLDPKKRLSPWRVFFSQFRSFIIYILLFAVIISMLSREYLDAIIILIILLFNALFGFLQEYNAEKAIEALKKLAALKATVLRDGKQQLVDAKELVPGDILRLEEGNRVPADGRILECPVLKVSEASLTGESVPVSKTAETLEEGLALADRKNLVFSGTSVTLGRATVLVTATGMSTEIGKIAGMLTEVIEERTPLQKKLEVLGKRIGLGTLAICLLIFIIGSWRDGVFSVLQEKGAIEFLLAAKMWLLTAVSLAVAAVPEGLPAIVTIALAIGVRKMLRRNALIRTLPSVETLGSATVICTDKTGTLTRNEMTVRVAYTNGKTLRLEGEGTDFQEKLELNRHDQMVLLVGALCNNASLRHKKGKRDLVGDPTETALLVSADKANLKWEGWRRIAELPFDSVRKMMTVVSRDPAGKTLVLTKGAPEEVLKRCTRIAENGKVRKLGHATRRAVLRKNEEFASRALRVLAFAYREGKDAAERDLIFAGLQGMQDPPHKEAAHAVKKCHEAGIRVIMVTGDNMHTAKAIAEEIGIRGKAMNGADFEKLKEARQLRALKETNIFARVEPKHKMRIIELLKKQGHVVAMTGDGVNDAPALKRADLGIAMGITGTDVAKESSDMVLQDDNFTSIVNAIEEGRGIYANITKFVNYLLSCNLGEVLVILLAILFGWPLPMTAVMLLWLNLVTDGLPALALSVDPPPPDLMKRPPRKPGESILNRGMALSIVAMSALIAAAVLGVFWWGMRTYPGLEPQLYIDRIETLAFTALVLMEIVRLQVIRSEYHIGILSNRWLVLAVALSLALQLAVIYTPLNRFFGTAPLSLADWGIILGASAGVFAVNALAFLFIRRTFSGGRETGSKAAG